VSAGNARSGGFAWDGNPRRMRGILIRRMWVKFLPIREDRQDENTGMRRKIRRSQPLLHRSQVVILPERSELRY